jgi:hypothetical protein
VLVSLKQKACAEAEHHSIGEISCKLLRVLNTQLHGAEIAKGCLNEDSMSLECLCTRAETVFYRNWVALIHPSAKSQHLKEKSYKDAAGSNGVRSVGCARGALRRLCTELEFTASAWPAECCREPTYPDSSLISPSPSCPGTYTCMYVCMYVCMYICMYACMYVHVCVCIHACLYACMYVCMYVYIRQRDGESASTCTCLCTCTLMMSMRYIHVWGGFG